MAILKLKNAGEEATLDIQTAAVVQGQYGEQVKFDTIEGDCLYAPIESVKRQLDRIGVAEVQDISGKRIHFARVEGKGGVVYWNIDRAIATDVKSPPANGKSGPLLPNETGDEDYLPRSETVTIPSRSVAVAIPTATGFTELVAKYKECVVAATAAWGGAITDEAAVAAAATLFIARNQRNV